jgi:iron complex transport system substrate-binding protein
MIGRRALLAASIGLAIAPVAYAQAPRRRIVSVGSDVTEILFALGLGGDVVAVDSTSQFPREATQLPQVGYLRSLAAEGILSLRPTHLVASGDVGPPTTISQLRGAGVSVLVQPTSRNAADVRARIVSIGEAFGAQVQASTLSAAVGDRMAQAEREVAAMRGRPRALFLISMNAGSRNAAGRDTAADAIISLAGGINPVSAYEGFRALSLEAAAVAQPDVVLMMPHTLDAAGGVDGVARNPAIAVTPAGRARRIRTIDGAYTLGFGPRLPEAALDLARLIRA